MTSAPPKDESNGHDLARAENENESESDDVVSTALWNRVREQWEDQAIHDKFLGHCSQTDDLPRAAALYRSVRDDPAHGARASAQLERIGALAIAQLAALPRSEPPKRNALLWFSLVVVVGGLLGWLASKLM